MSPPPPSSSSRAEAAMSLCRRCGLCCDGTLFAWVTVAPGELEPLRSLGVTVVQRPDGSPALRQPCPALSGRDCTVYAARPGPCRQFRCHQLIALEEGEIDLSEASAVVDRAHQAIRGLARSAEEPEGPGQAAASGAPESVTPAPIRGLARPTAEPEGQGAASGSPESVALVAGVVDAVRRQVAAETASPGARSALERLEALLARDFLGRARRA